MRDHPPPHPPISVVVPVFNGGETVDQCLTALLHQVGAILNQDYELVVVDDGSSDGTGDRIEARYPQVRLIRHPKNQGRVFARKTGVEQAQHDIVLMIDIRVIAHTNLLQTFWLLGAPTPCMAGDLGENNGRAPLERVFFCIRAAYYRPYPQTEEQPRLVINTENFLRAPKGTTAIFLTRNDYLSSLPKHFDRWTNDDTSLFRNLVQTRPLLRDHRLKVRYLQRLSLRSEVPHLFERGPRFADHYLRQRGPFRAWLWGGLGMLGGVGLLGTIAPAWSLTVLALLLLAISTVLARRPVDVIYLATLLPVLGGVFLAGVIKGMFRRTPAGIE